MYTTFLDKTMTYSSAYFKDGLDLGQAQIAKYDRIISEANIGSQDRVVEIGCGWGGFAIRAAQTTGCHVVGVTLSHEQLAFAKAKVTELGLDDKITFLLLDYRLVAERYKGQFDHVVSIEMIEAVGVEYLPTYFAALHALVKPSGSVMIQAISVVEAKYKVYCKSTDFIQQYIFPGGHCPSLAAIASAAADVGLTIHGVEEFGLHYAETLRQWDKKFMASRARLLELGYDERFIRMWHYYFCYCEAGMSLPSPMHPNLFLKH
jgi:cyclopropane-fatty-acyl-phospholipid synthase